MAADPAVGVVQAAAVAVDEPAAGVCDQLAERRDAVLKRPRRHRSSVSGRGYRTTMAACCGSSERTTPIAVVDLYRVAFGAERPIDAAEIVSWVRNQELKPEWLQVLEEDGRIVGYGDIWIQDDEVALEVAAPGHWLTFIEWAERRARDDGLRHVRLFFPAGHELAGIVERRGYRHWRSAFTMHIELGRRAARAALICRRSSSCADTSPATRSRSAERSTRPSSATRSHHEIAPPAFREFHLESRSFDPELWRLAWQEGDAGWHSRSGVPRQPRRARSRLDLGARPSAHRADVAAWVRRCCGRPCANCTPAACAASASASTHENETGALRLYERVGMQRRSARRQLDARTA